MFRRGHGAAGAAGDARSWVRGTVAALVVLGTAAAAQAWPCLTYGSLVAVSS